MNINTHLHTFKTVLLFGLRCMLCICFLLILNIHSNAQSNFDKIDKLALKCIKGHTKSCDKLKYIAKNGLKFRRYAISKIIDQKFLADIARNESNRSIRITALNNISDQNILISIAENNPKSWIRSDALKRIVNQDIIVNIALNDSSEYVRADAVNKIFDQNVLKKIVKSDSSGYVRTIAIKKIKDQKLLADIAKNDKIESVRESAFYKVNDQNFLTDIAKNDSEIDRRIYAINRIIDQNILADIAKNDEIESVRKSAFYKVNDQNHLLDIAKNGNNSEIQCLALIELNEHKYYQQIIEIVNKKGTKKYHSTKIGALKIIPLDKILKKNYRNLNISINITRDSKKYYDIFDFQQTGLPIGTWRTMDYTIKIMTDNLTKSFSFKGTRGGEKESTLDMGYTHVGNIDITEICEYLLSPLSKNDLLKISIESNVVYLRETAKKILNN